MGTPQELEGNRWSVTLAETCFVCLEIVLKVFVGFVWVSLVLLVFFYTGHRKVSEILFFSSTPRHFKRLLASSHPRSFFTSVSHILLILCCFLNDFCLS